MLARGPGGTQPGIAMMNQGLSSPVALGVLVTLLGVGTTSGAWAFCRGLTQAGPDPATTHACFDGGPGVHALYWTTQCVGFSLQQQASAQISLAQATPIVERSFATWSEVSCGAGGPSIEAVDEGPVSCGKVQYDPGGGNQHVIVFRDDAWLHDDPNNTLALTTITYDDTTGEVFDADMEINTHDHTIVADGDAAPPAYDLQSIVTHEAGHFLGLAHSPDGAAVMFTFYRPGSTQLTSDDVAGICSIYQPGGARSTSSGTVPAGSCDPTPRHGFSTTCDGSLADAGTGGADGSPGDGASGGNSSGGCSLGAAPSGAAGGAGVWARMVTVIAGVLARRRRARSRS